MRPARRHRLLEVGAVAGLHQRSPATAATASRTTTKARLRHGQPASPRCGNGAPPGGRGRGVRLAAMPRDRCARVVSAGAVVCGPGTDGAARAPAEVRRLVLPQGQARPRGARAAAAVREVAEETGLDVRLGAPLAGQRYPIGGRHQGGDYWVGRAGSTGTTAATAQRRDRRGRVGARTTRRDPAHLRLRPGHPREALAPAAKTRALVVLRHARRAPARPGARTTGSGRCWPAGELQAQRLVPLLAAYDVTPARHLAAAPAASRR